MRLDKWLWAARFYKTRMLASEAIGQHRVWVDNAPCKPSRELKVGNTVRITRGHDTMTVHVLGLSAQRGPAPVAQQLYAETEASQAQRAAARENRRFSPEPAHAVSGGRPTKRARRAMEQTWGDRWSASLDD
ncbi:MAG: RNA-binding S4 domain-containing protein, partial [Burkholderiaceae bacterium]